MAGQASQAIGVFGMDDRCTKKIEATWASWNNQLLLLSWFPPKDLQEQKVVVAGSVKPRLIPSDASKSSEFGGLKSDPWADYVRQSGRTLDSEQGKDESKPSSTNSQGHHRPH